MSWVSPAFLLCILVCLPMAVHAATWTIQPDGSGDAATIQAGIDSAAVADTVLLADGVFTGEGNRAVEFKGKAITLTSINGPTASIIDCEGLDRGVRFVGDEGPGSVLSGVTIRNAATISNGAGIFVVDASPVITGNIVLSCSAQGNGGGIYAWLNNLPSAPTITDNEITDCSAANGGGIAANGAGPLIQGNRIHGNRGGDGAGIYAVGFSANTTVTGNRIHGNTATGLGGGVMFVSAIGSSLTNNAVYANSAASGGGMYLRSTNATMVENNTVAENQAAQGAGLYLEATTVTVRRTIVAFNTGGDAGIQCTGTPTIDCCLIFGNDGGNTACGTGVDTLSLDPEFCGQPGSGNYSLQSDSPAVPANSVCGQLIGAFAEGCDTTPARRASWGDLKSRFR